MVHGACATTGAQWDYSARPGNADHQAKTNATDADRYHRLLTVSHQHQSTQSIKACLHSCTTTNPLPSRFPGPLQARINSFSYRQAAALGAAHEYDDGSYRWLLWGEDSTLWLLPGVLRMLQHLDPDLPYVITDNMAYHDGSPSVIAPRCLPCNHSTHHRLHHHLHLRHHKPQAGSSEAHTGSSSSSSTHHRRSLESHNPHQTPHRHSRDLQQQMALNQGQQHHRQHHEPLQQPEQSSEQSSDQQQPQAQKDPKQDQQQQQQQDQQQQQQQDQQQGPAHDSSWAFPVPPSEGCPCTPELACTTQRSAAWDKLYASQAPSQEQCYQKPLGACPGPCATHANRSLAITTGGHSTGEHSTGEHSTGEH
jgi:hypothetical protein